MISRAIKIGFYLILYLNCCFCYSKNLNINIIDSVKIDTLILDKNYKFEASLLPIVLNNIENKDYHQFGSDSKITNVISLWNEFMKTKVFDNVKILIGTFYENTKTDTTAEFFETNYMSIFELYFENNKKATEVFSFFERIKKQGMIGYNLIGFNGFVIQFKNKLFVVEGMDIDRNHYKVVEDSIRKNLGSKIKVKYIFR